MEYSDFSIKESIQYGWSAFIKNGGMLCGIYFVSFLIDLCFVLYSNYLLSPEDTLFYLVLYARYFVDILISMCLINVSIEIYAKGQTSVEDIFAPLTWRKIFYYIVTLLITIIAVLIGLVLLIIPGIIVALRLQFCIYYVIRDGLAPIDALRASWDITMGATLKLFGLEIVMFFIQLAGLLFCFIGLFAAVPITILAYVYVFNKLCEQHTAINTQWASLNP